MIGNTPAAVVGAETARVTDVDALTQAPTRLRVARLDGLRGLAVLSVVAFHAETHLNWSPDPEMGS